MSRTSIPIILSSGLLTIFALASCLPLAFSPEAVALQQVSETNRRDFATDTSSIRILQKQALGDSQFVLVSYQGTDTRVGKEFCLSLYQVKKMALGWVPSTGGGGCSTAAPDPEQIPISIGGSGGSDGQGDGFSAVSGEVYRDDIRSVHVTWSDGVLQQADVINNSYLAIRAGSNINMQKVEALDAKSQVVYSNEPEIAPGK